MTTLAWLAWLVAAVAIVWPVVRWVRTERELMAPLPIGLATLGFYVLPRAAYLLAFQRPPLGSDALPLDRQAALIAASLVATALAAAAFAGGHAIRVALTPAFWSRLSLPAPDTRRATVISVAAAVIGLGAAALLINRAGGLGTMLQQQYAVGQLLQGQTALFQLMRLLLVPIALLLIDERRRRSRPVIWLFAALALIAVLPFGRRSFIASAIMYPALLYHLCVQRLSLRTMLIAAGVAGPLLFAFSYLRLLGPRDIGRAAGVFVSQPSYAVHFAFNASGELRVFDALTIVMRDVPRELAPNYGAAFLRVPVMVIPRALWPTRKPVTLGEEIVRRHASHLRTGYPPLAVGEFHAAAGPGAIFLGCFLLGLLGRLTWMWFSAHRGAIGAASVYIALCYFFFDFMRVGDPSRTFWFTAVSVCALALAFGSADRRLAAGPRSS